ncbi:hypothetical protein DAPPUDRAFT_333793 [Daphnia pulex]|uniref:Uncharacterized protein n=1 Tax=Daphnia pulex TaxID=6669 RepID=E9HTU9_DAPPU|nr:hypothetical protein DAPPUDRAFT_333793 [Daphnia pulex]|eukprot:EFX64831.1 hypothetical protein DAPPUDRAFT_333793 [Daphnia pulex]
MATWEDQYLVYFPIVTGCGRVFKVPCSLTTMRQLLTEETGDRMDVMIKNFFENIKMENPSEDLLAMEFTKLKICGAKANRDLRNAERGMLISDYEDRQPITEFLKTAVEDNPENYPQNLVDGEPQRDDVNVLPEEYRDIAARIQEVFNILIEAPQVPPVERRNIRHEPAAEFDNPIPGAPREVRRVGRPRLHPLPQPRAINHRAAVPRIAHRAGNGGRAARNARGGARNARRVIMLDDEQLDEAENLPMEPEIIEPEIMEPEMPEMHIDIIIAPEDEVENMYHEEHVQNWEAGEEERRRLNYEFRAAEQNVQDDALRVFEDCMLGPNLFIQGYPKPFILML